MCIYCIFSFYKVVCVSKRNRDICKKQSVHFALLLICAIFANRINKVKWENILFQHGNTVRRRLMRL